MKDILTNSYNKSSSNYDEQFKELQWKKYNALDDFFQVKKRKMFLDAGAGTGLLYEYLNKKYPAWCSFYNGVDISPGMIREGQKKSIPHLSIMDIEELNYPHNYFDYVFSFTVIGLLDQSVNSALTEINRVLKKEGILVFSILKKNVTNNIYEEIGNTNFSLLNTFDHGQDFFFLCKNIKK
ncbi:methyltransferase domain-containing protein [Spirochaeta cellobiosiphila]|uniref:methyltransferase domain-containing protein n=1 Tax=Spirochaeta cellobiosiphila TaxID=504483 RepID=UPI0004048D96|nr:methyltransferase domain-containing protein [Spirochaeta cellobiosiphila]